MKLIQSVVRFIKEKGSSPDIFMPILFLLVLVAGAWNSEKYPDAYYGKPTVSYNYSDLHKRNVDQVLVDESYMYILPHHSNGVVQVCNKNGAYAYTLFFYENLNGHFSMAMDEQFLYVRDMKGNVYVFRNGDFFEFLSKDQVKQNISHIDLISGASSPGYEIRSNSIWLIKDGEEICLIATEGKKQWGIWWLLCGVVCLVFIGKMGLGSTQKLNSSF